MLKPILKITFFALAGIACGTFNVHANGRSPAIPSDVPKTAVCEDDTNTVHVLLRASIAYKGGTSIQYLEVRIGSAEAKLPLASIRELVWVEKGVDADGFAQAQIQVLGADKKRSYKVRVKQGAEAVKLTGYVRDFGPREITLIKCKRITFSSIVKEGVGREIKATK